MVELVYGKGYHNDMYFLKIYDMCVEMAKSREYHKDIIIYKFTDGNFAKFKHDNYRHIPVWLKVENLKALYSAFKKKYHK